MLYRLTSLVDIFITVPLPLRVPVTLPHDVASTPGGTGGCALRWRHNKQLHYQQRPAVNCDSGCLVLPVISCAFTVVSLIGGAVNPQRSVWLSLPADHMRKQAFALCVNGPRVVCSDAGDVTFFARIIFFPQSNVFTLGCVRFIWVL